MSFWLTKSFSVVFFKWDRNQGSKDVEYHDALLANTDESIDDVDDDSSLEFVNEYLLPNKVSIKQGKTFKTVIGD